jgi:8-oxo-dGTP pyrophosphatase MutT (NUDIX family)
MPLNPNRWGLFGGGAEEVDAGDPVATWCRELEEELGIVVVPTRVRALGERLWPDGSLEHLFYYEWPSLGTDFVLAEARGVAWFTFEAALGLPDLTAGARYFLPQLRERVLPDDAVRGMIG